MNNIIFRENIGFSHLNCHVYFFVIQFSKFIFSSYDFALLLIIFLNSIEVKTLNISIFLMSYQYFLVIYQYYGETRLKKSAKHIVAKLKQNFEKINGVKINMKN